MTAAIYRERARQCLEHADRHDAHAMDTSRGVSERHREVALSYRKTAEALTKLSIMIGDDL